MTWCQARELRISRIGNRCEVCGETKNLVGHHIIPRAFIQQLAPLFVKKYGQEWEKKVEETFNNPSLVRVRCKQCEEFFHKAFQWGNDLFDYRKASSFVEKLKKELGEE